MVVGGTETGNGTDFHGKELSSKDLFALKVIQSVNQSVERAQYTVHCLFSSSSASFSISSSPKGPPQQYNTTKLWLLNNQGKRMK